MIYLMEDPIALTQEQYALAYGLASHQRREMVDNYRFEEDRKQSLCADLLLRYALRREYGLMQTPYLSYEGGKPILQGHETIHFNLSHCCRAVACAVSDRPVGVDVQDWQQNRSSLAPYLCTAEELGYIQSASDSGVAFAQIWTAKESYGKYTGQGIAYDLASVGFVQDGAICPPEGLQLESFLFRDFALTYCGERKEFICTVSFSELTNG